MRAEIRDDIESGVGILAGATAPTILVGPGARGAVQQILKLAVLLGAPVMTTPDAKSMVDENSPPAAGVYSFGAGAISQAVVRASDTVVAIGTNLGEFSTNGGHAFEGKAILHVTDDPHDLPVGLPLAVAVVGDVALTVEALAGQLAPSARANRWFERLPASATEISSSESFPRRAMAPAQAMRALGQALPPRARLACDVTSAALHVLHDLKLRSEQRLWLQIERSACMGSALAAGLGVRLASDLPTLVVIGDWGLMMGGSELHTVASSGVDRFVVVVWSNSGGALIRSGVRAQGIDVPSETHSWATPQFACVARGYGLRAMTVRSARGLGRAAAIGLRSTFPVLIDAIVEPDAEIPGATSRYMHLETSKGRP